MNPPDNVPKIPQTIVIPPNNKSALFCQKSSKISPVLLNRNFSILKEVMKIHNEETKNFYLKDYMNMKKKKKKESSIPYDKYYNQPLVPNMSRHQ